jgi:hypothetical protein
MTRCSFRGSAALALLASLAVGVVVAAPASGAEPAAEPTTAPASMDHAHFVAGEELAKTVTLVTGVPISPLLGVSGLGAWRYFRTPEPLRAALPWYARPWFWASGFALVFLFVANTTIGAAVPGLKKPMDFVEEHENKLSALLATPIVLLEGQRLLSSSGLLAALPEATDGGLPLASAGLAAITTAGGVDGWVAPGVQLGLGVLSVACFVIVFLAFHAVQVLIALSPSALLDMLLRGFRLSMLGAVAVASSLDPYLGAAVGLAILLVAWLVAGWSFRLTVYGSVLSWDFLAGRDGSAEPATAPLVAFTARGLHGAPARSYGRLEPGPSGGWRFRWRPWLVLPARSIEIAAGTRLALRRGALSPTLFASGALREPTLARFPPRFRGREQELARRLGAVEVRDGRIVRGVKAAWAWLKELALGAEPAATPDGGS